MVMSCLKRAPPCHAGRGATAEQTALLSTATGFESHLPRFGHAAPDTSLTAPRLWCGANDAGLWACETGSRVKALRRTEQAAGVAALLAF